MSIRNENDMPLNLREWLLVIFIWALFFLQEQTKLIQFTVLDEILPPFWCGVIPGFVLIAWFTLLMLLGKRYYLRRSFYTTAVLALAPIILIPLLLTNVICHHEGIYSLFRSMFFMLGGYFLFLCLISINPRPKVIHVFFRILLIEAGFVFLLIALQTHTGFPNFVTKLTARYDSIRIPVQILDKEGILLLCYVLAYLVYEKSRIFKPYFVVLLIGLLYYTNFLWLTRSVTIQIIILLGFIMVVVFRKSKILFGKVLFFSILSLVFLSAIKLSMLTSITSLGSNMYSSMADEVRYGDGTGTIRLDGIIYYSQEYIKTGMIGCGMVDQTDDTDTFKELRLDYSGFNMNDIGIFETLFRFGIPAIIFVIAMLFRMERDLRKNIPLIPREYKIQAYAIWLLIVLELLTLPLSKAFFFPRHNMLYALLMFYVWQITTTYSSNTRIAYESN